MSNPDEPMHGQCLCGAIKYRVTALQPKMGHCHCTMCRKFHGAAFASYGEALNEDFSWTKGEEYLQSFVADNETTRKFCKKCGSSLIFQSAGDGHTVIEFALGTLDTDTTHKPDVHVYTEHKAAWFNITDSLPKFDNGRE